ncbi:hypothetical protein L9F63_006266, partial [Diploptera punctata]
SASCSAIFTLHWNIGRLCRTAPLCNINFIILFDASHHLYTYLLQMFVLSFLI